MGALAARREALRSARRTVRFRTAAGAVLIISVSLVVAAVAFDLLLGRELRRSFESSLATRATDRAVLVDDGGDLQSVLAAVGDEEFVAVVGHDGGVVRQQGLAEPDELVVEGTGTIFEARLVIFEHDGSEIERSTLTVFAAPTADGGAVVVGAQAGDALTPRQVARLVLSIGVPLLIVIAALSAWRLAGRALQPVEVLRRDVDAIAGSSAGERVTVSDAGDELTRLAETMNGLLDRVDEHGARQREFVADASHELKSPVANLRVLAETVQRPADEAQWTELRERFVGETDRLRVLVDDLLFLARADEGTGSPERGQVHLDDLVFDEAERVLTPEGVRVDAGGVTPCDVQGDAGQLLRVIRNLVENGVRHANSVVAVSTSRTTEHGATTEGETVGGAVVRLVVEDDGPGIPKDQRERVFERFARLDADRSRAAGGTGLGLAIVRQVAADHHGTVSVDESDLGGARFVVRLPTG